MQIPLAERMNGVRASEIRELLKYTARPEVISFAGGLPAPELFPVPEIQAAATAALEHEGCRVLQYSTTEGDPRLREIIAARMNRTRGTRQTADEVLVTVGSQQGLDLTGKLFLDAGDVVLCESPTYIGAIQAFRVFQPRFVEVPTDDGGMIITELERHLAAEPRARVIYVVPDFQNPSGRRWPLARRQALLEVAARYPVVVVEDSPYAELCFDGPPLPAIQSLDARSQVVYLGTFSKTFCPGLRLGWVAAPRELVEKYVLLKQGADLHTSTLPQRLLQLYLDRHDFDANIERIRILYRGRRDTMLAAMDRHFPPGIRYTRPQGGLFLWVELPERLNARDLLAACLAENVAFVPGGAFFPNGGHENTIRLNFSNMPDERIREGIRRLARVIRDQLAAAPDAEAASVCAKV
jgi:DNA-binding transcriptional MocR family regulator